MKVPLQRYWEVQKKYLAPFKKRVILLAFLLVSGTVLLVVTPLIIENYINLAVQDSSLEDLSGFFRAILRLFTDNDTIFRALVFLASVYIFLIFIIPPPLRL